MSENAFLSKNKSNHILYPLDKYLKNRLIMLVPRFIQTYHLTMFTLLWSLLIIVLAYIFEDSRIIYLLISIIIILQYFTDLLDGEVGRRRKTGLVLWGFFMDHFLDYVFLCSLGIGYFIIFPKSMDIYVAIIVILISFMFQAVMMRAITMKQFNISTQGISATEIRLLLVIINIVFFATGMYFTQFLLMITVATCAVGIFAYIFESHKLLWEVDMNNKKNNEN